MSEDEPKGVFIVKKGVVFLLPCYKCPEYHRCLESDEEKIIKHLLTKVAIHFYAKSHRLKIVSDEKEWIEEVEKLVGRPILNLYYDCNRLLIYIDEDEKGGKKAWISCGVKYGLHDGFAVVVGEIDGKPFTLVAGSVGYDDIDSILKTVEVKYEVPIKDLVKAVRVELMESDFDRWEEILIKGTKHLKACLC